MVHHVKRSLVLVLVGLLACLGGLAVAPQAAFAASCKGDACNGKSPHTYGCESDAKTIDEFTDLERFELRYSKKCDAVWTRVISKHDYNTVFGQIQSQTFVDHKQIKLYGVQVQKGTVWTKMVGFSSHWVRSCVSFVWFTSPPDECTSRH